MSVFDNRALIVFFGWLVGVPAITAIGLRLLAGQRPDHLGHFLAGHGASLVFVWLVARLSSSRPLPILLATVAAVGLGWMLEAVVFPLGGFDAVDYQTQSFGAVIAGLTVLQARLGDPVFDPSDGSPIAHSDAGRLLLLTAATTFFLGAALAFS